MPHSPPPNPQLHPPLGRPDCPDPYWNGGRAVIIGGCEAMLGPTWLIMVNGYGLGPIKPPTLPIPPEAPFFGPEGSIPFVDDTATP